MKPNQQRSSLTLPDATSVARVPHRIHISKRRLASFCAVALGLSVAGFPRLPRAEAGGMNPLLLHAGGTVTVLHPDESSAVRFSTDASEYAMPNFNGKFVASTKPGPDQTTVLEVRNPWNATMQWSQTIVGQWRVEAVSSDARYVVLGDPSISADAASVPKGRVTTNLVLAGDGVGSKLMTFPGNFVAEAFLADGAGVALIEHLPPSNPATYRVRPLAFFGVEQALLKPVGGLKTGLRGNPDTEQMQGIRLNQSWNDTGDGLYTLYDSTSYPKGEGVFVHGLDLVTGLARCLDVPRDIDAGVGKGKVLFTGTGKLIVAGRKGIVRMDAKTGKIEQKLRVQMKNVGALFSQADRFFVSDVGTLQEYQTSTLKKLRSTKFVSPLVAGTIKGQMPPIVLDEKGSIWYAISDPVKRGTYSGKITNDTSVLVQEYVGPLSSRPSVEPRRH